MRRRLLVGACVTGTLMATPVFADAGIPMISCIHPGLWLALPLVILLEWAVGAFVVRWKMRTALKVSFLCNLTSTLVGIPLKWLLVWSLTPIASSFNSAVHHSGDPAATWSDGSLLQRFALAVIERPGLGGWGITEGVHTRIWTYWAALLAFFFLLSAWVEWRVALRLLGRESRSRAAMWAWIANSLSYALLIGLFWHLYGYTWWWMYER